MEKKKFWWARLGQDKPDQEGRRNYGHWVPTGCEDKDAAIEYLRTYYRTAEDILELLQLS